jgi:hypothetical protein
LTRQRLIGIGKLAVAGLLIWWLVTSGTLDLSALGVFFEQPGLLVANVLIFVTVQMLAALRWRLLLRSAGVGVSVIRIFLLNLVGAFFNVVVPGNIGGDILKAIYVARDLPADKRTSVYAITFFDRIVALSALVVVAAVLTFAPNGAGWTDPRFHQLSTAIVLLVLVSVVAPAVLLVLIHRYGARADRWTQGSSRIGKIIGQLVVSARLVSARPGSLLAALALAIVVHLIGVIWFATLATAITAQDISVSSMASVYPIGMLSTLLPISWSGFGIGHVAFEELFAMVGLHGGATVLNVYLVGLTTPCLFGVIPYLAMRREVKTLQVSQEPTS